MLLFFVFLTENQFYIKNKVWLHSLSSSSLSVMATANKKFGPFVYIYDARYYIFKEKLMQEEWWASKQSGFMPLQKFTNRKKNIRSQQLRVSAQYRSDWAGTLWEVVCTMGFPQSLHNTAIKSCFWFQCCYKLLASWTRTPTHWNIFHRCETVTGKCDSWFQLVFTLKTAPNNQKHIHLNFHTVFLKYNF